MCMLTYIPQDIDPDMQALANGSIVNDDGHGFAIIDGSELIIRKTMNAEQALSMFEDMRKHYRGPAIFHSRWATAGKVDTFNVHPFYVGDDTQAVVAHNGVLPGMFQPRKGDKRSDTRILAEQHLHMRNLDRPRSRRRLGKLIGWDKLVFLNAGERWRERVYIINEHRGVWDDGVWYSNRDYLGGSGFSYVGTGSVFTRFDDDPYYVYWDDYIDDKKFTASDGTEYEVWGNYKAYYDWRVANEKLVKDKMADRAQHVVSQNGWAIVSPDDTNRCKVCDADNSTHGMFECRACGSCLFCQWDKERCRCWVPSADAETVEVDDDGTCTTCGVSFADRPCACNDYDRDVPFVVDEEGTVLTGEQP